MTVSAKAIPLLGYVDKLSGRPGDVLEFKVSSLSTNPFEASLVRSISADPNPAGPGIIEEDASEFFRPQSFESVERPFCPGSYGVARSPVSIPADAAVEVTATIFPTLLSGSIQSILTIGEFDLRLDEQGAASVQVNGKIITTDVPLKLRNWYQIVVRIEDGLVTIVQQMLGRNPESCVQGQRSIEMSLNITGKPVVAALLVNGRATQHFNGKIENPKILANDQTLCAWDFSPGISTTVVSASSGPDLDLINFPTRAMTSSAWDASEMNWAHKPDHYSAIHFHEDDIYDFEWGTDFSFKIPDDMPSGVYAMKLECDGHYDEIPFFVCAPIGLRRTDLCVLISTFTYTIYGNHARPDYVPEWQERIKEWDAYPYNPAEYPHYGLSTYNYHPDGSGICHASHRRPLFNLRPGYFTFGNSACSGLRHFPADMHLISWLHAKGIDYDLITDAELHNEGAAAIAGYRAVSTATHPEYHTENTLNALRDYRDFGGNLLYLGGNGFYWRIAIHEENDSMMEIRRAEDGIRAWAAEPGEYYNAFDGTYGGLWRRNGRAPQDLVGIGFAAQGEFFGDPYKRVSSDPEFDWVFEGIADDLIGDFGLSGNGAAGFELDHIDYRIGTPQNTVLLAQSVTRDDTFMLVPEEQLTHLTNLSGGPEKDALRADMIYTEYPGGGSVFATGSITFCGSLPWNNYENNVSQLLKNVVARMTSK